MRSIIIFPMSMPDRPDRGRSSREGQSPRAPGRPNRRLTSHDLLADRDEVINEHAGQEYHLRHTRTGKLILTK
ncbi:MAG: hemin uptake protein HemP [Gammaproteobacteria bacterium]